LNTKVSIIVPNYNHATFLKERIDSILNQTYQNFELILLDDCSTDNSVSILNTFKNHPKVSQLIINEENSGSPFKQWRKGIELAQYDWIWIAESDDVSHEEFLFSCLSTALKDDSEIVYSQSYDVDSGMKILQDRIEYTSSFSPNIWMQDFNQKGLDFTKKYLLVKNVIPNASAVIFKKPDNLSIEWKLIESFKMCGDWLFWIQLCQVYSISFVARHLNFFRTHDAISRNHNQEGIIKSRILEEIKIRNFIFESTSLYDEQSDFHIFKLWNSLFKTRDIVNSNFRSGVLSRLGAFKYIIYFIKRIIKKFVK
jgi:glycosyltransferase involved in cell wall biosynthesis